MDAHSQSIECKNDESIHKDFSHLDLQEFTLTFPDREGYIAPKWARRNFYVSGLENLPVSIEKIQYGRLDRKSDNWMAQFGNIDHLLNLREVVIVKPNTLKTGDFNFFLQFPKLEKIVIVGGKKRKRIPKALRSIIEIRKA